MNLPKRAKKLIHEYSRPITRPDWRLIKPLTFHTLCSNALSKYNTNIVLNKFVDSISDQIIPHNVLVDILSRNLFHTSKEDIQDICSMYDMDITHFKLIMQILF